MSNNVTSTPVISPATLNGRVESSGRHMHFVRSSLGKKYLMAASGLVLLLFVIGHMVGNLQFFLGPTQINIYGNFLQTTPELLWSVRIILLIMVVLHIYTATAISLENRAARPVPYGRYQPLAASYASRRMLMGGLIVAAFIAYHLLHYTAEVKAVNLTGQDFATFKDASGHHDIHRMMVIGFSNPWVTLFYLVGVGLLALHLSHGASSMFQSLGWKNGRVGPWIDRLALAGSIILFAGYASIPLSVLTGLVK